MADGVTPAIARVRILATKGSTPRGPGTEMYVWPTGQSGTIGGGALEHHSVCAARDLLMTKTEQVTATHALGPNLNQCCGGAVTVEISKVDGLPDAGSTTPVVIFGAGHVAQALCPILLALPGLSITVCDTRHDWLSLLPDGITLSTDADATLASAPATAHHFIMTPKHDVDLSLCDQLLRRKTAFIGLIGSQTKWARFRKRLKGLGHNEAEISNRITCPIGEPDLGKHPAAIAVGVAARLIVSTESANRSRQQTL